MGSEDGVLTLSADEREALTRLIEGVSPHSAGAKAILALADRNDVAYAADQSGLTYPQVRHWYGRFQADGLQAALSAQDLPPAPDMDAAPEAEDPAATSTSDKKKSGKKKSGKKR